MTQTEAQARADSMNDELTEDATLTVKIVPLQQYAVVVIKSYDESAYDALSDANKLIYYSAWLTRKKADGIPAVGDVIE